MPRLKKAFDARRAALPALSGVKGDAYRRVLDTLSLKRRKPALSLSAAARESGTTLRTIRRHAPSVLETRSGRLDVQASDRLPRPMRMLTPTGEVIVNTRSSRTASRISRHNNAVRELYTSAGDTSALKPFNDKTNAVAARPTSSPPIPSSSIAWRAPGPCISSISTHRRPRDEPQRLRSQRR